MISMELALFGDSPLGIWVVVLSGSSDCVAHGLHDCHAFDGLYIEVILRDPSSVSLGECTLVGPHGWHVE